MGLTYDTAAVQACMKSSLMLFNLAFWASGLAILCAGIWMQVELHKYLELSADFSDSAPFILCTTGALILLVASLACFCTLKGQSNLLYAYGGFLAIVLIMELTIAGSIYAYRDRLVNGFDKGLNRTLNDYGPDDEVRTFDFDIMQKNLHCCGIHSSKDWSDRALPIPVPKSCCSVPEASCDVQDPVHIYDEGCYSKIVNFLRDHMARIGGIALGVALFPLVGTILACSLAANVNKTKYEQMA